MSSKSYMKALQTVWPNHQGSTSINELTSPSATAHQRSVDASIVKRSQARRMNEMESSQSDAGSSQPIPLASPTQLNQALEADSGDSKHRLPCRVAGVTTMKSLGLQRGSSALVSSELCRGTRSTAIHQLGPRRRWGLTHELGYRPASTKKDPTDWCCVVCSVSSEVCSVLSGGLWEN